MNPKSKKTLLFVFGPSAFKLGLLVTLFLLFISRSFYNHKLGEPMDAVTERMSYMHQDSIDLRLRHRGPRKPTPEVAIITVDEMAVEKLGRWPWPRGRIAEVVELLMANGARVVGFDAIFSEPDNNQAVISLNRLKDAGATGSIAQALDAELAKANTDAVFAETVKTHADHVILGNFFDPPAHERLWPYQHLCANLAIDETPEGARLDAEEKPLAVNDETDFALPEIWTQATKLILDQIAEEVRKKAAAQGKADDSTIRYEVLTAQFEYCDNWLLQGKDKNFESYRANWEQGKAGVEGWQDLTFEDAVEKIKYSPLKNPVPLAGRLVTNLKEITANSKHNAYFNAFQDSDGTIRKSSLLVRYGSRYMPSLALKSVMVAKKLNALIKIEADQVGVFKQVTSLELVNDETGDVESTIPVDSAGSLAINYAGRAKMFPHVSVSELFNGKDTVEIEYLEGRDEVRKVVPKKEFFKDKIMIFGATAIGIYDLRVTPFAENYPGVETHANVIDNLIRKDFLYSPDHEDFYMYAALAAIGVVLSIVLSHVSAVPGLLLALTMLFGVYLTDRYYLFKSGYVVAIIFPILLISALYVTLTFYKYLTEERKKKAIKGTFEKYVSPAIVAEVLKDPSNLELGGKKQRMTVMFSDVRGFTTIAEKLDPQALSAMLNSYLTPMTELVFKNKGTLDKYMGDAIMSFYGAPIHYGDHAKMAVQCALDMIALLPKMNENFAAKGLPPIDIGIGLNTGDMSVGNMGSETVRSYTVMGDAVNLASRLEGINKQYGTRIIISEFTYSEVKNDFICREVDWVRVKGKLQPVKIFEVISRSTERMKDSNLIQLFEKGTVEYHLQNWDTAIDCFSKALNIDPEDAPSKLFLQRSSNYKEAPPPKDWDGVFEMKTK